MPFDLCYEPIVVGQNAVHEFFPHDCIRALDIVSGDRKWIFFADARSLCPLYYAANSTSRPTMAISIA